MKRFISLVLVTVMLVSALAMTSNAAGTLIFSDTFDSGFTPRNWITDRETCHFEWDNKYQCIQGYDSAVVLQSNYGNKGQKWWDSFYGEIDFQVRAFDDYLPEHEGRDHDISFWYCDMMERGEEAGDASKRGATYVFTIDIRTGDAKLNKSYSWDYYDEHGNKQSASVNDVIATGKIDGTIEVGEDAPWYSMGVRVTSGKLEYYFNEKLVLSSSAADGKESVGGVFLDAVDATVGSQKSAVLVWNGGNWLALDNFEIWSPDYDFVPGPAYVYGDVNGDDNVNLSDISMMLQAIAKWEIEGYNAEAGDVNGDGAVNLSDVSKTLQAIAKWEGVVLGPVA